MSYWECGLRGVVEMHLLVDLAGGYRSNCSLMRNLCPPLPYSSFRNREELGDAGRQRHRIWTQQECGTAPGGERPVARERGSIVEEDLGIAQ